MRDNPFGEDKDEIRELIKQFQNLRLGRGNSFLEEDAFEKIIDYFDDIEDMPQALEAVDMGIDQYLGGPASRPAVCSRAKARN